MIPNFAVIGVQTPKWHGNRLWIPLFLLWIPIVLLSPIIFLVLAVLAVFTRTTIWRIIAICWGILSGLPGTDIRVNADGNHIQVRIL